MKRQNFLSRINEFSKTKKIFFVFVIFATSFLALDYITQFIDALTDPTITLTEGVLLPLRDIRDLRTVVTVSGIANLQNNQLTITVTDPDANIHPLGVDVVFASATSTTSGTDSATIQLTEAENNPGTFSGIITLSSSSSTGSNLETGVGDQFRVFYPIVSSGPEDPEETSQPNARMEATFTGVSGTGDAVLSDFPVTSASDIPCPALAFIDPVDLDLTGTATATGVTVTISYVNGLDENGLLQGNPSNTVVMLYKAPASGGYVSLTPLDPGNPFTGLDNSGHDSVAPQTITNVDQPSSVEGRYTLGIIDAGCSGGGGGGLVRAGLVVNALAGLSAAAGGGGGLPGPTIALGACAQSDRCTEIISLPQGIRDFLNDDFDPHTPLEPITDIYDDFDLPLSINGNGFALARYENTLVPQTVEPGEPIEFKLVFYTNSGVAYTSLNFNLGPTRTIAGSDTQVLLYKDKPAEVIDPNGNIASATGSINNEGDLKRVATFSITFSESAELPNSDIVIRSWTNELNSGDIIVYDAIDVASPQIVEIADEDLPEPEIQTLKSQYVPIWIKNNAAWWSQELIEDSDFVAGIEYLIQQEIITLTDTGTLETNSSEIPEWIKNNAGWWSKDLITEKEFIDGLQWLISNGIIQVTET